MGSISFPKWKKDRVTISAFIAFSIGWIAWLGMGYPQMPSFLGYLFNFIKNRGVCFNHYSGNDKEFNFTNKTVICRDRGLNPRPPDFSELYSYESGALPTKPPRLRFYCAGSTSGGFCSSVGSMNS
ncbi:MAG: hypothetical protein AMDU2_EPLC00007G0037 [Thermoplasmatales archaeon E-plasma]|nr:MAG: hypothetical protein AMDU2_EPLC00007G0037 [Thermoplasmatales archaeon E-plasma]